jgi:hypothetical protein
MLVSALVAPASRTTMLGSDAGFEASPVVELPTAGVGHEEQALSNVTLTRTMKKVIVFLAAGLVVIGILFALAGSRTQKPPLANIPVRTVLPKARPLVWLDERLLLTGVDNKIVELDSRDAKIVHVVSESYYPREGYECFSRQGGRFALTAPEVSGSGTSYQNMVYRWIQDWARPAHFTDFKPGEWRNPNPHDCTAVGFKAAASIEEQSGPQLMKAAHGARRSTTAALK